VRQDELHPAPGSRKKKKLLGRGTGSGHGVTSTKGIRGQKSRSSVDLPRGFEGGQIPLTKRLPQKRGFTNIFKTEYSVINLDKLGLFAPGTDVSVKNLVAAGLVKSAKLPLKVLGSGEIDRPLNVTANRFSATAKAKIVAAGGKTQEIEDEPETK
jgi:large subunit ribosomal protein L15